MLQYFSREMVSATLIRGTAGAYVSGEWVPAFDAGVPISIIAPQPISANALQMLSDGERRGDYLESWSSERVFSREGQDDSDRIVWKGTTYKVTQADDRTSLGNYYKFEMKRLEPAA
jgi:hypothetical protein